jgi:hypothetical protein
MPNHRFWTPAGYTAIYAARANMNPVEAAHENAQRHRQLSCHGRRTINTQNS